jgi:hypothetical protein
VQVQGFSLKSARRRAGHRVKSYDETQAHVETLRKAYALEERKYNRIDESTYLHEQADGSVTVDEQALKRKMRPLAGMLLLAAQIRDGLARARKIARSVVAAERAIIKRLSGSLKHAKKKDRSGILAQLRGARGDLAEWGGTADDLKFDVANAKLDVLDLGKEYRELVGTSGKAADAPDREPPTPEPTPGRRPIRRRSPTRHASAPTSRPAVPTSRRPPCRCSPAAATSAAGERTRTVP